jgi:hypothetical protein
MLTSHSLLKTAFEMVLVVAGEEVVFCLPGCQDGGVSAPPDVPSPDPFQFNSAEVQTQKHTHIQAWREAIAVSASTAKRGERLKQQQKNT